MSPTITLAPGADQNGFAVMLSDLVRQNLEAKPHKERDFRALSGSVAIVAEDADVALTLVFDRGKLTIFDGIYAIPDATIRGPSETILALSNMPLVTRFALPLPDPRDRDAIGLVRGLIAEVRAGRFRIHGGAFHLPLLLRLTRVMSING